MADEAEGYAALRPEKVPIQFCLAADGAKTAIIYYSAKRAEWGADDAIKSSEKEGSSPWDTQKYLNVWVANLADSVSAYATMPWADKSVDGIVIDYEFFGTMGTAKAPFDGGKTLTHLVGNYLGLKNLWSSDCRDDGVFDTPIHNSPNRGCPGYKHLSLCDGNPVEFSMNYMDNTDDKCMYFFSFGQMQRMFTMLSKGGPRYELSKGKMETVCQPSELSEAATYRDNPSETDLDAKKLDIQIIPNPADNKVGISIKGKVETPVSLLIYDALGKIVEQRSLDSYESLELATHNWTSGIYFIFCKTAEITRTYQLIINH